MHTIHLDAMFSFTLAILLLFVGKAMTARFAGLQRFSIPDAVIGGICCSALVFLAHVLLDVQISLTLDARDTLLLYFFAAIGLGTDVRTLREGGQPMVVLLALASGFIVLQNAVGMGMAAVFGLEPLAGLMTGSIALTGGVGTTLAWTPYFTDTLGIGNAQELGLAANMLGMISACLIGGPVASWLMRRHQVQPSADTALEIATLHKKEPFLQLNYYGVLLAIFWLNLSLMLGRILSELIALTVLNLPAFVGCLMAGIAIRGLGDTFTPLQKRFFRRTLWDYPRMQPGIALISDICLGLFLMMALMGLRLWELQSVLGFISAVMLVQIVLVLLFTVFVVFRLMGRDYEAAVICSGFGGIALGSTATAIANMTAVTKAHGNAPRAFIVVPLVCGFFIDLVNALVIGLMAR